MNIECKPSKMTSSSPHVLPETMISPPVTVRKARNLFHPLHLCLPSTTTSFRQVPSFFLQFFNFLSVSVVFASARLELILSTTISLYVLLSSTQGCCLPTFSQISDTSFTSRMLQQYGIITGEHCWVSPAPNEISNPLSAGSMDGFKRDYTSSTSNVLRSTCPILQDVYRKGFFRGTVADNVNPYKDTLSSFLMSRVSAPRSATSTGRKPKTANS